MRLSIGMMIKNESKHLRECLQSLQSIRDAVDAELIIVDTGSTDNSVEIAKEFTDKVYYHEWNNNFSEMRNITINYATGEWFLVIDGDEVISNPFGIIQFFNSNEYKKNNTACISVKNYSLTSSEDNYSVLSSPRLFKKDEDFRYEGAIHNQPKFKQPVIMLNSELVHYGYVIDDKELMERKFQRTSAILQSELKNDPENIYYLFQLSVSYAMHKDFAEALEPIYKACTLLKSKKLTPYEDLYVYGQLSKIYLINEKYREAEQTCLEVIKEDSGYIDLYFYLAKAQFMQHKNELSIKNYNEYLKKIKNYSISKNISIINDTLGRYEEAYLDLINLYDRSGEFEKALDFAGKISSSDILDRALNLIILSYIKLDKFNELRDYYEDEIIVKHNELRVKFLSYLEQYLLKTNLKTRIAINKAFSEGSSEYSLLNKFRVASEDESSDLGEQLDKWDFNKLPNYYGDLLYYLLCKKVSLEKFLNTTYDFKIKSYFNFLNDKYDNLGIKIYEYLESFKNSEITFDVIRINKILAPCVFKSNSINDVQYKEIFDNYLENGYYYLEQIYNNNILQNELVYYIKDEEDLFLMYMHLAQKYKEDKAQYLRYLRMALSSCNYMKKGIEMLSAEVSLDLAEDNNELDDYKIRVKEVITDLINNTNLFDAKRVIAEYEEIIKNDSEICSMKAVIAIMENRLEDAEFTLKSGLKTHKNNFDLLYNLGYVYENTDRHIEAIRLYNMAKNNCNEINSIREIEGIISKNIEEIQEQSGKFLGIKKYNIMLFANNESDENIEKLGNIFNIVGLISNKFLKTKDKEASSFADLDYMIILEKDRDNIKNIKRKLSEYISTDKIYDYYQYNYLFCVEGFEYKFDEILKIPKLELLATGLSYVETAVDSDLFNIPSFNFALSSQDLFYDYNIVKNLLNLQHVKNSLKYCIIGLAYYSFDFDLSKSNEGIRTHRYLSTLGTAHNFTNIPQLEISHYDYLKSDYNNDYLNLSYAKENTVMHSENKDVQNYIAIHHSEMNHPETVEENEKIFKDYLDLLKENNIKPIVVICPTSVHHYQHFMNGSLKNRFYDIINEFQRQYNFQILDYFDSDLFDDNDFWDYSHLNKKGAYKFTKILSEMINW